MAGLRFIFERRLFTMQQVRRSADSVFYEPAEFCGRPILGTGYPIDHATVPAGIHSYDYLHVGDRYLITSERGSQYAEGTVLLKDPLVFGMERWTRG